MKPSRAYYGGFLILACLMVGLFFEVGPEVLLRDHSTTFLTMMICGATASILRGLGR